MSPLQYQTPVIVISKHSKELLVYIISSFQYAFGIAIINTVWGDLSDKLPTTNTLPDTAWLNI